MYGYRARIGYCSPPFVTETFAYEFYQMVPQGVTLLITTLEVRTRAPDEIKASHARSLEAAKYMASAGADVARLDRARGEEGGPGLLLRGCRKRTPRQFHTQNGL